MPPITSQRSVAYNQLNQFMQFANASGRSGDEIVHLDAPSGKLSVDGNDRIKRAGNLWSAPQRRRREQFDARHVQARFDFIASLNCANEKIVQRMEA